MLNAYKRYECVMQLAVFNDLPAFLNASLRKRAQHDGALATRLANDYQQLRDGLDLLVKQWRNNTRRH